MSGVAAPSCAVLGSGSASLAATALRRAGRGRATPLLIRWGADADRRVLAPSLNPRLRREAVRLAGELPAGWVVGVERRLVVVDVVGDDAAEGMLTVIGRYDGPVAVAIGRPRCDGVDAVLRIVDEVVVATPGHAALRGMLEEELRPIAPRLAFVRPPTSPLAAWMGGDGGQSTIVAIAVVATLLAVAAGLGIVATALGRTSDVQGRADVAALAGAKALLTAQPLLYSQDPAQQIDADEYRRRGRIATERTAHANDLRIDSIAFLGSSDMPTRIRVSALSLEADGNHDRVVRSTAEVALAALDGLPGAGEYRGPFAIRQGQRMRPDVALAFDRMNAAATAGGHPLVIVSAFRSDAEQAVLFAKHPDPKWVAPPGKSLHRLGTELDLGPNSAYAWLAANASRFGYKQRYSWEAWHFGFIRNPGSASLGFGGRSTATHAATRSGAARVRSTPSGVNVDTGPERASGSAIPSFVPAKYAPIIAAAAQRWSVGAALLGAQIQVESGFNPNAQSPYAAGISQFTPGTAAQYGMTLAERFDPSIEIPAQAHLMHDLLAKFGSVPLALAAYNAGEGAVGRCMCVPAIPETQGYVQRILALLGGAGLAAPAGLQIRLVA